MTTRGQNGTKITKRGVRSLKTKTIRCFCSTTLVSRKLLFTYSPTGDDVIFIHTLTYSVISDDLFYLFR